MIIKEIHRCTGVMFAPRQRPGRKTRSDSLTFSPSPSLYHLHIDRCFYLYSLSLAFPRLPPITPITPSLVFSPCPFVPSPALPSLQFAEEKNGNEASSQLLSPLE